MSVFSNVFESVRALLFFSVWTKQNKRFAPLCSFWDQNGLGQAMSGQWSVVTCYVPSHTHCRLLGLHFSRLWLHRHPLRDMTWPRSGENHCVAETEKKNTSIIIIILFWAIMLLYDCFYFFGLISVLVYCHALSPVSTYVHASFAKFACSRFFVLLCIWCLQINKLDWIVNQL